VIIPAHNESALIGRLLARLVDERLQVIVVANGCTDATAAIARSVSPRITVLEIDTPSKVAALNAGDAATQLFPRAYVDADVNVTVDALLALAEALPDDLPRAAAPRFVVDTTGADAAVGRYYAVWALSPYRSEALVGAGVYALSRAGRARFGAFPEIIADDQYVQELFAPAERIVTPGHEFSVESPRTVPALLGRLTRSTLGNEQLRATLPLGPGASGAGPRALVARVARTPAVWFAFPTYALIYLRARRDARRLLAAGTLDWTRDESTRA
jgi:hypothetical protein